MLCVKRPSNRYRFGHAGAVAQLSLAA